MPDTLSKAVDNAAVLYAVQTDIFCRACKGSLNAKTAGVVEWSGGSAAVCLRAECPSNTDKARADIAKAGARLIVYRA